MTLDFSLSSLSIVDDILLRYHDDGLGGISYALQTQAASYVGEVLTHILPDAQWTDGADDMDPRVLSLPNGGELNLVSKVGKLVRNGPEDALHHFVTTLLDEGYVT